MTMPGQTRYDALLDALRELKKSYDKAENDRARLDTGINAIRQVALYLRNDADVRAEGLIRPIGLIENAVHDAGQGAKPILLDHPPAGKPKGTMHEHVQGALAWALELVTVGGKSGTDRAAVWVAAEAKKAGLSDPGGGAIMAKQVVQWRKDIRSGRAPAATTEMWDECRRWDDGFLRMPPSDLKPERARRLAEKHIRATADIAPRSAPKAPREP